MARRAIRHFAAGGFAALCVCLGLAAHAAEQTLASEEGSRQGVAAIPNVPCGEVVPPEWELVFSDEFDGTALDTSKWQLHGNDSVQVVNGAKGARVSIP